MKTRIKPGRRESTSLFGGLTGSPAERSFALVLFLLGELCFAGETTPFAAIPEAALLLAVFLTLVAVAPAAAGEKAMRVWMASLRACVAFAFPEVDFSFFAVPFAYANLESRVRKAALAID